LQGSVVATLALLQLATRHCSATQCTLQFAPGQQAVLGCSAAMVAAATTLIIIFFNFLAAAGERKKENGKGSFETCSKISTQHKCNTQAPSRSNSSSNLRSLLALPLAATTPH